MVVWWSRGLLRRPLRIISVMMSRVLKQVPAAWCFYLFYTLFGEWLSRLTHSFGKASASTGDTCQAAGLAGTAEASWKTSGSGGNRLVGESGMPGGCFNIFLVWGSLVFMVFVFMWGLVGCLGLFFWCFFKGLGLICFFVRNSFTFF